MARRRRKGVPRIFTQPAALGPTAARNSEIWGQETHWYVFERNLAPGVSLAGRGPLGPSMRLYEHGGGPSSMVALPGYEEHPGAVIVTPSKLKSNSKKK